MSTVRLPGGQQVHAHKMIVELAKEMAHEVYSVVMRNNAVYDSWKVICPELTRDLAEAFFVDHLFPYLIEDARATLAGVLATNISEDLKESISEAIIRDTVFREGRRRAYVAGMIPPGMHPGLALLRRRGEVR